MVSAIVPANGHPAKTSALSGVADGDAPTLERVDEVLETDGESCRFLDLVMDRDSTFFRLVYVLERECLSFCGEVEVGVGFGLVCAHPDRNMVSPIVPANGHPRSWRRTESLVVSWTWSWTGTTLSLDLYMF